MVYNNSLTQDLLTLCQEQDYDPEGQYVDLFQGNPKVGYSDYIRGWNLLQNTYLTDYSCTI